ncbi:MAG TPA: DnaJ domain-containing protein [Bryobacterales bacterium]|jgi:curved DNA-binding protein CbpA|nr:DnaJ domain-containing protein [Bryobacterales bacterium]
MNYYAVLGVDADADEKTIRSAFRALARRYHPDAGEGSSEAKFRQVLQAYEVLSNPVRRREYDQSQAALKTRPPFSFGEVRRPAGVSPAAPLRQRAWDPFLEARTSIFEMMQVFERLWRWDEDFFGEPFF